ncbi:MAG: glycoside hydrolase family 172 protein [Thermoguttaceae bacterium]
MTLHFPTVGMTAALVLAPLLSGAAAGQGVADLYRIQEAASQTHMEYHHVSLPKGKEMLLGDLKGPGKVTYWYITDDSGGKFYPGLVLKVFWDSRDSQDGRDGQAEPSIHVPLADFFGAVGGHTIDYQSAPMQIQHFCYMCCLPMPFSTSARFVLANDGDRDYSGSMAYAIDYEQGRQYAAEKSRLCCAWRRSNAVKNGLHTILDVTGRGHYVGNFLQVRTRFAGWWGEGDTIFRLDGKKITHTPGTEDEYGACWGFGNTYSYLYSGYLQNEKGQNRMYRWYVGNPVRFRESLKVQIQNQHTDGTPTTSDADDYTSVAFWYQEGPARGVALQPFAERTAPSKAGAGKP